jgi:adenylate cyclase
MCVCFLAFNGFYLFDRHDLIVGMTGPLLAAILVWSGITVPNFITEIKERNRITRRFSNYVDPSLVNYVIEHPEQAHFDGESREMTMGFTDLKNFTTLTESLGPRTILLLNEYIGRMVPIIRNNQGYVSRLMGDGIYFFFNAPGRDDFHAAHAVATALQMHAAVDEMNLTLPGRNYPTLSLRAGICTGTVIVGDAGARELFSDYTAMGDAVNTAARLETANKNFSTRTLIIERTVELLEGQYLCRPIANVRVAGKTRGVMVYEPLCRTEDATAEQKKLAEMTADVVKRFHGADFRACIEAARRLEEAFGESKFSSLYKRLSEEHLISIPEDFCGLVILTEK